MASETLTDTRPQFSRLTQGTGTRSWRSAVPVIVVLVAVVGLLAYLVSSVSSSSQKAMSAERDANDARQAQTALAKQVGTLQKDLAIAKSPGRTTIILQTADKKAKDGAWAAVTWGELPGGKSFMR